MVLVTLVIGGWPARARSATRRPRSPRSSSELDRIQSTEGPLARAQIDRMNAEVDQLIGRESRLRQAGGRGPSRAGTAKQAELDKATAELNAEKAELARVRAKLQQAVGALEQLLVDIYKSNDPDVTAVVMRSAELVRPAHPRRVPRPHPELRRRGRRPGARPTRPDRRPRQPAAGDPRPDPGRARRRSPRRSGRSRSQHAQIPQQQSQLPPPETRGRQSQRAAPGSDVPAFLHRSRRRSVRRGRVGDARRGHRQRTRRGGVRAARRRDSRRRGRSRPPTSSSRNISAARSARRSASTASGS